MTVNMRSLLIVVSPRSRRFIIGSYGISVGIDFASPTAAASTATGTPTLFIAHGMVDLVLADDRFINRSASWLRAKLSSSLACFSAYRLSSR
jgi:hypothetical protein